MDISTMRAFCVIRQEKSLSKAAEKLFISKQALSATIKKTESELGVLLLTRESSGVELTRDGLLFYEYADAILKKWTEYEARLRVLMPANQRLNVGFGYMSGNMWTKEVEERFRRANPAIELKTEVELSRLLLQKLDAGEIDLLVTCMQHEHYAQYRRTLIHKMDIFAIMCDDDPLCGKKALSVQDLEGRKILYPDSGHAYLKCFHAYLSGMGIHTETGLVSAGNFLNHLKSIREQKAVMLSDNVYKTVMPEIYGYTSRPLIPPKGNPPPEISIYALTPLEEKLSTPCEAFIRFFRDVVENTCAKNTAD